MKVVLTSGVFYVDWEHLTQDKKQCTLCHISQGSGESHVTYTGMCLVNSKYDRYDKETGRKLSLTRALQNQHFSREDRTKVWRAYNNRKSNTDSSQQLTATKAV